MAKFLGYILPSAALIGFINWAAIYGTIQAFAIIPVSLHWLVALLGVALLIPLNLAAIGVVGTVVLLIAGAIEYFINGGK